MPFGKLGKNTQMALVIFGAVLAVHFYAQMFYKPLRNDKVMLVKERAELESEIELLAAEQEQFSTASRAYEEQFQQFSEFEQSVQALEAKLPSRKDMAALLGQLTEALETLEIEFLSLEPAVREAGRDDLYDAIDIEVEFYADYERLIEYLRMLEGEDLLVGVSKLEAKLNLEAAKKPLSKIKFSTFISERRIAPVTQETTQPAPEARKEKLNPFFTEGKPFDNRLPGDHELNLILWKGGTPVALIDGRLMKIGSVLDNKVLNKIDSEGVWFQEDGIHYFLALEK